MATYVMSDIHGCFDEFMNMMKKIEFTEDDQLIITGDYIDRGPKSYEMLKWIENIPDNILLLKGNHDIEFSQYVRLLNEFAHGIDSNENVFIICITNPVEPRRHVIKGANTQEEAAS